MTKVFLDIDIGDSEAYRQASEAHTRAKAFLAAVGSQFGLPPELSAVDEEGVQMLKEAYAADPTWASKGPMECAEPALLRAGRIVVELNEKDAPKAAENFRCLVTGVKGIAKASKKPLHYKGTKFHRIVKGFCCQGGDIVRGDGSSGDSIWGGKFNDEKGALKLKHDKEGILSMDCRALLWTANSGRHSNASQFFITLAPAPQCDGKHVVFGHAVEGLDVLQRIDQEAASADGAPRVDVTIADCGVL